MERGAKGKSGKIRKGQTIQTLYATLRNLDFILTIMGSLDRF